MERKADSRSSKEHNIPHKTRKIVAIAVLGVVLLACLLSVGYFGVKTIRHVRLRRKAMEAYEKKDYALAERLLRVYVRKDPNAEAEFVALANIYHEFGNTGFEAQMWQTASSLNPLNSEYRDKMLTSAMKSASYALLHGILGRKAKVGEEFTDRELYLYVISSYRSGYPKDGEEAYQKAVKADPEAFHKDELGRLAEFMAKYADLSDGERDEYLYLPLKSEDPVIRFEALYIIIRRSAQSSDDRMESLLKQAAEINYFVGTQLLADFYFSKYRFEDVCSILEPYLKMIDDLNLYLLYAETCVFMGRLDELKALEKNLRRKSGSLALMADYCEILIAFLEEDEEKLTVAFRKSGKLINSPLSRFIRLRVGMANDSFNEILTATQEIFSIPPFHDLTKRATLVCLDYLSNEMQKPEKQRDPSHLAELAKILSGYLQGNQLLTVIILMDQYKKGLVKETELLSALEQFPDDAALQRLSAEYLILNGKAEQALNIIEPVLKKTDDESQKTDYNILFLYMLALDQVGRHDEASSVFQRLVEQTEFNPGLLNQYFQFCISNKREEDLKSMADKLEPTKDGKLEHFGKFFRAAALLMADDKTKEKEALDILVSTPTDNPDFTFYAANRLSEHDRLDEAEAKYKAILKAYRSPSLIYVNLSELYHEKGDKAKALEAAKEAFDMEKSSMLPAFIYAKRLSETERYEDAVRTLNFPRRAANYREDIIALWSDCMHHVIEKSMADQKYLQAEEQCKHLLIFAPDDEFGREKLEQVREILLPKKDGNAADDIVATPAA